jgi:hypothetical protein
VRTTANDYRGATLASKSYSLHKQLKAQLAVAAVALIVGICTTVSETVYAYLKSVYQYHSDVGDVQPSALAHASISPLHSCA